MCFSWVFIHETNTIWGFIVYIYYIYLSHISICSITNNLIDFYKVEWLLVVFFLSDLTFLYYSAIASYLKSKNPAVWLAKSINGFNHAHLKLNDQFVALTDMKLHAQN